MALTLLQQIRLEVGDTDPSLPILTDTEYEYFLDKNNNSVSRSALDSAKTILFKMAQRTDSTVDIFSIKPSSAARAYMDALKLYIRNPDLNSIYKTVGCYSGGISIADMQANDANLDNNIPIVPSKSPEDRSSPSSTFFTI